jgi:hypothetical protein
MKNLKLIIAFSLISILSSCASEKSVENQSSTIEEISVAEKSFALPIVETDEFEIDEFEIDESVEVVSEKSQFVDISADQFSNDLFNAIALSGSDISLSNEVDLIISPVSDDQSEINVSDTQDVFLSQLFNDDESYDSSLSVSAKYSNFLRYFIYYRYD